MGQVGEYIQNRLPIRLLHVPDMKMVGRNELQNTINTRVGKGEFNCRDSECHCFEKIKPELEYSILSHRWGDNEVVFYHFQKLREQLIGDEKSLGTREKIQILRNFVPPDRPSESSIDKLENFLHISEEKQCKYAWADTICINKESSAELDESIRSMFAWYRDSHICIVHLNMTRYYRHMEQDPWFTRGWTLQELLAPRRLAFYTREWQQITSDDSRKDAIEVTKLGRREGEELLWPHIAKITGIDLEDLLGFKPGLFDIRKRLTWASRRRTTRVEDMAYCLIGIFNINLSIAYGEKEGAFYRLQVEILQNSDDMSLFDWQGQPSLYNSMLAASPECFVRYLGLHTNKSLRVSSDS
ncbi:hypothetical protein FRC17_011065, partial [Serendipita sp. 399]